MDQGFDDSVFRPRLKSKTHLAVPSQSLRISRAYRLGDDMDDAIERMHPSEKNEMNSGMWMNSNGTPKEMDSIAHDSGEQAMNYVGMNSNHYYPSKSFNPQSETIDGGYYRTMEYIQGYQRSDHRDEFTANGRMNQPDHRQAAIMPSEFNMAYGSNESVLHAGYFDSSYTPMYGGGKNTIASGNDMSSIHGFGGVSALSPGNMYFETVQTNFKSNGSHELIDADHNVYGQNNSMNQSNSREYQNMLQAEMLAPKRADRTYSKAMKAAVTSDNHAALWQVKKNAMNPDDIFFENSITASVASSSAATDLDATNSIVTGNAIIGYRKSEEKVIDLTAEDDFPSLSKSQMSELDNMKNHGNNQRPQKEIHVAQSSGISQIDSTSAIHAQEQSKNPTILPKEPKASIVGRVETVKADAGVADKEWQLNESSSEESNEGSKTTSEGSSIGSLIDTASLTKQAENKEKKLEDKQGKDLGPPTKMAILDSAKMIPESTPEIKPNKAPEKAPEDETDRNKSTEARQVKKLEQVNKEGRRLAKRRDHGKATEIMDDERTNKNEGQKILQKGKQDDSDEPTEFLNKVAWSLYSFHSSLSMTGGDLSRLIGTQEYDEEDQRLDEATILGPDDTLGCNKTCSDANRFDPSEISRLTQQCTGGGISQTMHSGGLWTRLKTSGCALFGDVDNHMNVVRETVRRSNQVECTDQARTCHSVIASGANTYSPFDWDKNDSQKPMYQAHEWDEFRTRHDQLYPRSQFHQEEKQKLRELGSTLQKNRIDGTLDLGTTNSRSFDSSIDGDDDDDDVSVVSNTKLSEEQLTALKNDVVNRLNFNFLTWRSNFKESLSDLCIYVTVVETGETTPYHVHRMVLSIGQRRSAFFSALFHNQESNSHEIQLELPAQAADVFPVVLDYMYGDDKRFSKAIRSRADAFVLYGQAEAFEMPGMMQAIARWCRKRLKLSKVTRFVAQCQQFKHYDPLIEIVIDICIAHFDELLSVAKTIAPIILIMVFQRLAKEHNYPFHTERKYITQLVLESAESNKLDLELWRRLTNETYLPSIDSRPALKLMTIDAEFPDDCQEGNYASTKKIELTSLQERCVESLAQDWDHLVAEFESADSMSDILSNLKPHVLAEIMVRRSKRRVPGK